jgi:Icc-related predicted phosphoesterase
MKLQIFSDLHYDVAPIKPISIGEDVDVVVVAGDTCQGVRNAFIALRRIVPERVPIIMVAGNHEHYRRCIQSEIAEAKAIAADYNIVFLENEVAILGTTRFIGATLWTNYRVFGDANAAFAMDTARWSLNDHRVISWTKQPWTRFRPEEALLLHERSKAFIANALTTTPLSGSSTVVLTHHAPHFGSVAKGGPYESDILTAAYVSDLTDVLVIDAAAGGSTVSADTTVKETAHANWNRIWLHAHIHSSSDYVVGTTRILANPHGYGLENPGFNSQLVVEVGSGVLPADVFIRRERILRQGVIKDHAFPRPDHVMEDGFGKLGR